MAGDEAQKVFPNVNPANIPIVVNNLADVGLNWSIYKERLAGGTGTIQGPPGQQGDQGPPGFNGINGVDGQDGIVDYTTVRNIASEQARHEISLTLPGTGGGTGIQGPEGESGPQGPQGIQGPVGPQGPPGSGGSGTGDGSGIPGPEGPMGPEGPQGIPGMEGPSGPEGLQGIPGIPGLDGIHGLPGDRGMQGPIGIPGIDGQIGPMGPAGLPGTGGGTVDSALAANVSSLMSNWNKTLYIFEKTGLWSMPGSPTAQELSFGSGSNLIPIEPIDSDDLDGGGGELVPIEPINDTGPISPIFGPGDSGPSPVPTAPTFSPGPSTPLLPNASLGTIGTMFRNSPQINNLLLRVATLETSGIPSPSGSGFGINDVGNITSSSWLAMPNWRSAVNNVVATEIGLGQNRTFIEGLIDLKISGISMPSVSDTKIQTLARGEIGSVFPNSSFLSTLTAVTLSNAIVTEVGNGLASMGITSSWMTDMKNKPDIQGVNWLIDNKLTSLDIPDVGAMTTKITGVQTSLKSIGNLYTNFSNIRLAMDNAEIPTGNFLGGWDSPSINSARDMIRNELENVARPIKIMLDAVSDELLVIRNQLEAIVSNMS